MENNMIKAVSADGSVSITALDSTNIVAEMESIHHASAVVTAALGRLLTAASLMGSGLKNERDSITLRVDGKGPAGLLVAVTDGEGNVRGYTTNAIVEIPLRADGKLDVGRAVGHDGVLSVVKDLGMKEPYIGQTPLVSGEIGEDMAAYFAASEQTPSVCALGVLVNPGLTVRRAGGFLIQLLPGAAEESIALLEKNIAAMPTVTNLLEAGGTPWQMAEKAMEGLKPKKLEERRVEYRCYCNREKTLDILYSLGREELEAMREEESEARVECHFCNKNYRFDLDELLAARKA